jgi:hypothetical protein
MQTQRDPEIEIGHLAIAVADLLAREMDEVFQDALHQAGTDTCSPHRRRASVANRVVVNCRVLVDDIRRYERLKAWEMEEEEHQYEESDTDF